ncbi:thiol-disulfide oxidoreductase DCC family protein [Maribacter algicola]|uniref:thiol-disulfide oxidoreductase DCC family protein n=1 Tax=Maribacter algicola TaxID=2498892 RepID=UPI001FB43395|nr:thiol-disulfide oxidoreductase DCC family protein [Maribacter algicola]
MKATKKIILFDGVCNVCNSFVQFVIKRDHNDVFQFTSLQSDIGIRLLNERNIESQTMDSVVLIDPGVAFYIKSDAALEVGKSLKGYHTVSKILYLIPSKIRDIVYDLIARNRYTWFGKKNECMVPTPEIKSKFL